MVLPHKYTDLQDEFKTRIEGLGVEPRAVLQLREQLTERDEKIASLRAEIRDLTNDRQQLERVIDGLSSELQHSRDDRSKVIALHNDSY